MNAEIITIGDEILIGQIVDTNSAWIANELNKIGIRVSQIRSISDDENQIVDSLNSSKQNANLVILTGGLGPTSDDITKQTLASYFGSTLKRNKEIEEHINQMMQKRGIETLERNVRQADLPSNCKIIFNSLGTAPGMWFEKENTIFISLPGIPFEMKVIMNEGVIPELKKKFNLQDIYHRTILTKGLPESVLAEKLLNFENQLKKDIKLAYLPSPESIKLRFSIFNLNHEESKKIVTEEIKKLKQIIPDNIFGEENQTLQEVVGNILREQSKTISTAESCTGGNIAHLITEIAGCSDYFKGSVVAYSNKVKQNVLNVSEENLLKYGAVSQQVVEEMAKGAIKLLKTDYAIATSGIAGPEGGTTEKPVGTVWIAVASKDKIISKKYIFSKVRNLNIRHATNYALDMFRLFVLGKL